LKAEYEKGTVKYCIRQKTIT